MTPPYTFIVFTLLLLHLFFVDKTLPIIKTHNLSYNIYPVADYAKKFCTSCGRRLRAGSGFCTGCGKAFLREKTADDAPPISFRSGVPAPPTDKKPVQPVPPPRVLPVVRVTDPSTRISGPLPVPPPLPPEAMPPAPAMPTPVVIIAPLPSPFSTPSAPLAPREPPPGPQRDIAVYDTFSIEEPEAVWKTVAPADNTDDTICGTVPEKVKQELFQEEHADSAVPEEESVCRVEAAREKEQAEPESPEKEKPLKKEKEVRDKEHRRRGGSKTAIVLTGILVVAAVVGFVVAGLMAPDRRVVDIPALDVPPNVRIMEKLFESDVPAPELTIRAEIGMDAQKEDVRKLLDDIFERYTAFYRKAAGRDLGAVTIYLYASEEIWRESPGWWVGRLKWERGGKPVSDFRMDAVLPRSSVPGYGYTTPGEYLDDVDSIARETVLAVDGIRELVRKYDAMDIDEKQLRERAELRATIMSGFTRDLPEPPGKEYEKLHKALEKLVEEARFFQSLFPADGAPGDQPDIDLKTIYKRFKSFDAAHAALSKERKAFALN